MSPAGVLMPLPVLIPEEFELPPGVHVGAVP